MSAARVSAIVAVAVLIAPVACTGRPPARTNPGSFEVRGGFDPSVAQELQDALDDTLARSGAPGAQAAVAMPNGPLWVGASGWADVDERRPFTPDTLFPIASVTKTYTATVMMKLVEEGVLSLDDPLSRWVPGFPHAEGVTIEQLLDHTSGLAALAPPDIDAILDEDPGHRFSNEELLLPPVCPPGTCFHYQAPDYGLLGLVMERATDRTPPELYRSMLFDPLGLRESFVSPEEPVAEHVAAGYRAGTPTPGAIALNVLEREAIVVDGEPLPLTGGGIVQTAGDLATFGAALFGGRILEPASLTEMLDFDRTRGLPGTGECFGYGLGVQRGQLGLEESWGHGGNAGTFRAALSYFPRQGVTVVTLVNDGSPIALGAISEAVGRVALARSPVLHPDAGTGVCNYDVYAIDASGRGLVRLTTEPAADGGPIRWSPDGTRIAFGSDRDGNVEVYVLDADGSGHVDLTNDPAKDVGASWSPDGTRIAFFSDRDGDAEIYVMDADGADVRQLTSDTIDEVLPAWSPDGTMIAFASGDDGAQDIVLMTADGSQRTRLTSAPGDESWPTWSPNGSRVAFASDLGIWIVDATGPSEPVRIPLPSELDGAYDPDWGPTDRIAFRNGTGDLWTVASDGSDLVQVTDTLAAEFGPGRSPDGRKLAFASERWIPAP